MFSNQILYDGLIYTAGFALIILISVLINPRIWMQDFPDHLKEELPPKSRREARQTFVTGFLFALFIMGFPLYSISKLFGESSMTFGTFFLHSFSVMMVCNVLYWLVLHIFIFNVIISRIRTVPGLKKKFKFPGWKKQIFGMLVGVLSCGLISLIVALIAGFFQN